jgi:hypothetical protein
MTLSIDTPASFNHAYSAIGAPHRHRGEDWRTFTVANEGSRARRLCV